MSLLGSSSHGGGHASILAFLVPRRVVSAATRGAVALLLLSQAFALAEQEWACGSGAMAVHPAERWPRARAAAILGLPACGASTEAAAAALRGQPAAVPDGYEVSESKNGLPVLKRSK